MPAHLLVEAKLHPGGEAYLFNSVFVRGFN